MVLLGQGSKSGGKYLDGIDHTDRVSHDCLLETNLKGTLVLFTSHFQYCATEKLPTPELLARLCGMIE